MLKILSQTKEPIILETTIVSTDEGNVVVKYYYDASNPSKVISDDMMWEDSGKYLSDDCEDYSGLYADIEEFLFNGKQPESDDVVEESLEVVYTNVRVTSEYITFKAINAEGKMIIGLNCNDRTNNITGIRFMKRVPLDTVKDFCLKCIRIVNGKRTKASSYRFSVELDELLINRKENSDMVVDQYKDDEFGIIISPEAINEFLTEL